MWTSTDGRSARISISGIQDSDKQHSIGYHLATRAEIDFSSCPTTLQPPPVKIVTGSSRESVERSVVCRISTFRYSATDSRLDDSSRGLSYYFQNREGTRLVVRRSYTSFVEYIPEQWQHEFCQYWCRHRAQSRDTIEGGLRRRSVWSRRHSGDVSSATDRLEGCYGRSQCQGG